MFKKYLKLKVNLLIIVMMLSSYGSCEKEKPRNTKMTAKEILGNPNYQAISYGGYRENSRTIQPTIEELKEDMRILAAMDIKLLRTYNTKLDHASNVLEAINQLKKEDNNFEMYVMLGTWIDCENAWSDQEPNHEKEDIEANTAEIERAVILANKYADIVKIIAVGNEAMVRWATEYYVQPAIILKWVNHLQRLKKENKLPKALWITSSDNFAPWGGQSEYHSEDLEQLIKAVDFISIHTYPMHDTHYNPQFWGILKKEDTLELSEKLNAVMQRALHYAQLQYQRTAEYIKSIDSTKSIHIGETGWASASNELYGKEGSRATDQLKQSIYYNKIRHWTNSEGITCFYFQAFDEIWKDAQNPGGSENNFGLFDINGQAKYVLWDLVDNDVFEGLERNGVKINKTHGGIKNEIFQDVKIPPIKDTLIVDY